MAISWVEINRTSLRSITIAERGDEAPAGRTDAVVAAAQYILSGSNTASLNHRIDSELALRESQAYTFIPAGSSDGVLVYMVFSTTSEPSTGLSVSSFVFAGLVGPPYNFSDSACAFRHFRGHGSVLPSGSGVSSTRYYWGTRSVDICI
jgi:hypothetical protein